MAELISGTFKLADDEAIAFLNTAAGTAFNHDIHEVESVEVTTLEGGEKELLVVVNVKG